MAWVSAAIHITYRICYSSPVDARDIYLTNEVAAWLEQLQASDRKTADLAGDAIYTLSCSEALIGAVRLSMR